SQNWYDVWFPTLAPSLETMAQGRSAESPAQWAAFVKKYRAELESPEAGHALSLLAALSHSSNFSVGCYCEEESRCHRSVLRELLVERGGRVICLSFAIPCVAPWPSPYREEPHHAVALVPSLARTLRLHPD